MQSILLRVQRGYRYWFTAEIQAPKIEAFVEKMDARYQVQASPMARARAKARGTAGTVLIAQPDHGLHKFWVVVLSTRPQPNEGMRDAWDVANRERLVWRNTYQLCQLSKPREGVVWTWRLAPRARDDWALRLIDLARSNRLGELNQGIASLRMMPMFAGVRSDVLGLFRKAERVWTAAHRHRPEFQARLPWPKASDLPKLRRVQAYDSPPLSLGVWLDAYEIGLKKALEQR